ncbi:MAG: M67 family metallopeptidase [Chloroflexi bacterium]|nr:M67 family metallopeptidase [Chloroflexota bacterium]
MILTREHVREIERHVALHAPLEACGLLAGKNNRVEHVLFVRNQAESPVRFVMDPVEQLRAFDWMDAQRLDLLGIFHSHPAGPETVSPTDIAEAAYPVVHVVCSQTGGVWKLRGFWIENDEAVEIVLRVVE